MSFTAEVKVAHDKTWYSNAIRFKTWGEAHDYGLDLGNRWTAVEEMRVNEDDEPVTHGWHNGRLVVIDYEPPDPPGWEGGFADNH